MSNLVVEVDRHIATVRLDRPPVNALNSETYEEMTAVFRSFEHRADVHVVVFTATGKYFSVGRDIKAGISETPERRFTASVDAYGSLFHCAVPVISAVNGPAIGGGFSLVLNCDIVVASTTSSFSWPEINLGLIGGMSVTSRSLSPYLARKLYFTGESISPQRLHDLGVVDSVVSAEDLIPTALKLAADLAAKPARALRAAKWAANEVEKILDFEQAFRAVELRTGAALSNTPEFKDAVRAFVDRKNRPNTTAVAGERKDT
jgi:enoyl-CoA hydratase